MVNKCCVTGCTVEPSKDVYYFKVPTKTSLRRKWLDVIKPVRKLSLAASVCSAHFQSSDYVTVRGRPTLKRNSVPLNLQIKSQTSYDRPNQSTDLLESTEKSEVKLEIKSEVNWEVKSSNENGTGCESETEENGREDSSAEMIEALLQLNGEETGEEDPNSIEIQITPDIIEDYNTLQVTPDIIEDGNALKPPDSLDPDINEADHDIEDILTNYHIMNPPDRRDRELEPANTPEESTSEETGNEPTKSTEGTEAAKSNEPKEKSTEKFTEMSSEKSTENSTEKPTDDGDVHMIDDDDDEDLPLGVASKPVFIEINVDKERAQEAGGDCLMVLESLQCSIDPTSLMLPEPDEVEEIEIDDKYDDDDDKRHDPISLLTSSDSDEVIIEEPHIDCVSVSDETDEDDVPLVRLVKPRFKPNDDITRILWGTYEYYCKHCHFATYSRPAYNSHQLTHSSSSSVIQICQVCGYTTASEYQFIRHKKKHKDERRFKCHLCDYKARHNMSLMYHLKTHDTGGKLYRCDHCPFQSDHKSKTVKHMKTCQRLRRFSCDQCKYSTKRRSDLKRHKQRRHQDDDDWT